MLYQDFSAKSTKEVIKIGKKSQSRNDQRSNAKNPNNPAYKVDQDNRSKQLNPEDETYEKSRAKEEKDE